MPTSGTVFFSLADRDKEVGARAAQRFVELGFEIVATSGTAARLEAAGVPVSQVVAKLTTAPDGDGSDGDGSGGDPQGADAVALISDGKVDLVVNSPRGRGPRADGAYIRSAAASHQVPLLTTAAAALAAANGIADWVSTDLTVRSLQEYHRGIRG
jgi:carbamoyl-phosphate synthase large subunit